MVVVDRKIVLNTYNIKLCYRSRPYQSTGFKQVQIDVWNFFYSSFFYSSQSLMSSKYKTVIFIIVIMVFAEFVVL